MLKRFNIRENLQANINNRIGNHYRVLMNIIIITELFVNKYTPKVKFILYISAKCVYTLEKGEKALHAI